MYSLPISRRSFLICKSAVNEWYQGVLNDISQLQTFDFDNIACRIGATVTSNITDTVITETMVLNEVKIAERITNIGDTVIRCVTKAWDSDGSHVLLNSTTETTITDDVDYKRCQPKLKGGKTWIQQYLQH